MITDLLDQIDRLDQEATKGPWTTDETEEEVGVIWGGPRLDHGYIKQLMITDVVEGDGNAEFIALARTALPQLAIALRAVMDCVADMEQDNGDDSAYSHGVRHMAGTVRHIITDTLKGDDDAG